MSKENDLLELMQREIETMRQLLGNLHQEEMFILQKEKNYWNQLMEERGCLIGQLGNLRERRQSISIENNWEILALQDQILALLDRMNLQISRNEMLTQLSHHQEVSQPQQKRKISIATQTLEDYKCEDDK